MCEKIKIVRREFFHDGCYYSRYYTFVGFTGMPATFPFMTKWKADEVGLDEDGLLRYMQHYLTTVGKVKVVVKAIPYKEV